MSGRRVLLTGGTSLMVRRTAERLLARGDEVVLLQRRRCDADMAQVLGDIRDADTVQRAVAGCDAVVHAAAKVGVNGRWDEYRSINVDGTSVVVDAARRAGVGTIVYVSTPSVVHAGSSVVGAAADAPVTGRRVSGRVGAFYAESKAIAEPLALAAADASTGVVAVRPHLVWGPGDTQLVGRIVERARAGRLALVGGGTALIDTTYIDNAADALVAALDAATPGARCSGRAYVIANGEPRPVRELVEAIVRAAGIDAHGRRIPLRLATAAGWLTERVWSLRSTDDEPPLTQFLAEQLGTAHWFDPRPAHDDLGWTPAVSLDEGFAALTHWFATRQ
ncbi:MAG: NAD-dependent epimerase/dehydratase family protein [Ilumatobacteraceae bacterium]